MALNNVDNGNYEETYKEMQLSSDALAKAHNGQTLFLHKRSKWRKNKYVSIICACTRSFDNSDIRKNFLLNK